MANPNYTENEIKLYVPDLDGLKKKLDAAGIKVSAPRVYERNVRYDTADGALRARNAIIRLREDTRVRITYKEDPETEQVSAIGKSRFEAETEVKDFDTMQTILNKLGFQKTQIYEKYRTTYEHHGAEITLDEMPFGGFVEIEGTDGAIRTIMNLLDLSDAPRFKVSYMVLFEWVKTALKLDFIDLTFENFKGIDVPLAAFRVP